MNYKYVIDIQHATIAQSGKEILRDVNFRLREAETCYLVGKSGSGKSSFLKALYGVAKVTEGQANVLDYDLTSLVRSQLPDLRRSLGMVFQDFYLFKHWTVASNLSFVMVATDWRDKVAIRSRVEEVLDDVGLLQYFNSKVYTLSGGEQQRLAIARAIINKPKLIIADEPTGNLDPDTSNEILYLLNKLSKQNLSSMILATHDYRLLDKFPSRVFKCDDGQIVEVD